MDATEFRGDLTIQNLNKTVEKFLKPQKNCLSEYVGSELSLKRGRTSLRADMFGVSNQDEQIIYLCEGKKGTKLYEQVAELDESEFREVMLKTKEYEPKTARGKAAKEMRDEEKKPVRIAECTCSFSDGTPVRIVVENRGCWEEKREEIQDKWLQSGNIKW